MDEPSAFSTAVLLVTRLDPVLVEVVLLSLGVSFSAVLIAVAVGMPAGALLALARFPGRNLLIVFFNAFMGLPPVVAGLAIYLLLSRAGPLGSLGLLYTPTAMVIAQTVLVLPIIVSLSRQLVEDLWGEYEDQLRSLGSSATRAIPTLLWDGRFSLLTVILAGFGRASAEVGAVIIVGGNIAGVTRTMTTAIALETSKGNLALALGLGFVLLAITLLLNVGAFAAGRIAQRTAG